ncbi:protein-glutamate O-methyltransferase [Simiduia sp. 21SJ11W-1]|uniref:CheR family methyltransferase n=1 Tax=Simiduia sp. 21SJ11W-1 TaxID=2909669 RepID=UPI0020A0CC0F|nr:protein-glutamate O-methyltransferase [Simiduia sp. 21SJ11W-1]UTA47662.1 protein-glutamate O-methyltransferase [Simiduia sp. 21SJ11W-1]
MSPGANPHELTEGDFRYLCELVRSETGIVLGERKREMVYRRLMRRIRDLKLPSFAAYIALLKAGDKNELPDFINSMTTNLTSFFREAHHFEFLANTFVPEHRQQFGHSRRLRVWSAGCSTGEEPYSIAMTLLNAGSWGDWDMRLLATDLDSDVLAKASSGLYAMDRLEKVDQKITEKFFLRGRGDAAGKALIKPHIKEYISFKQLNLLTQSWPFRGPFDVIFCRNVLIYFDKETQAQIVNRFQEKLRPGGYLMLGHSESIGKHVRGLEMVGRTIFRRSRVAT